MHYSPTTILENHQSHCPRVGTLRNLRGRRWVNISTVLLKKLMLDVPRCSGLYEACLLKIKRILFSNSSGVQPCTSFEASLKYSLPEDGEHRQLDTDFRSPMSAFHFHHLLFVLQGSTHSQCPVRLQYRRRGQHSCRLQHMIFVFPARRASSEGWSNDLHKRSAGIRDQFPSHTYVNATVLSFFVSGQNDVLYLQTTVL